nr:CRISPR system precrRNA processing endoribonuclease RAMP protein Cas6 [Plesiomonas shigelloides]
MTPALQHVMANFKLLKLTITIQFQQDTQLPAFKGSMLHGWFGHALKAADEHAYLICYGEHENQQPKPYIICPSDDHKTEWRKGELYRFELSLFGEAIQLLDSLFAALKIGERLGFGPKRTPFQVLSIATQTPFGYRAGAMPSTLANMILQPASPQPLDIPSELAVTFITPARFKYQGLVCKTDIPNIHFLNQQILRRLIQLTRFWVMDEPELFDDLYAYQPNAYQQSMSCHCYFEDWQRFSLKRQEHLPFGGLKGQISFYGELAHFIPLLKVGELLHIGGKTTFGLGKYQLIA